MNCPLCTKEDVIEIHHRLPDGSEVAFYTCHGCEEKWWKSGDHDLTLDEVLGRARKAQ